MSARLDRALILLRQSRLDLAEAELRLALADAPGDPRPHAFLALCLADLKRFDEAIREASEAIGLAPGVAFVHSVMARVLMARGRTSRAVAAIEEAIRIDPEDADSFATLAALRFEQRRWADALRAAETGLTIDAEHVELNNLRAMALIKLGRRDEAGATLATALARDPEDPLTHANQGWALLERGLRVQALEHFREALRLDPNLDWARAGVVEAMKARNPVYWLMLRYFLWTAKLGRGAQWVLLLALIFGRRALEAIGRAAPTLAPLVGVALILVFGFVILTWIAVPLFNLLLRLDRYGRLALSRSEVVASNWLGAYLLGAAVALVVALATGAPLAWELAGEFGLLLLPVGGTFLCPSGWPRSVMLALTLGLTVAGPGLAWLSWVGDLPQSLASLHRGFVTGVVLSTWAGVFLGQARPRS